MKVFSKLLSIFLVGMLLVQVGCTDYDEDIRKVNDRIDELVSDQIDPLKADLEATKAALEGAIAAANAEIANNKAAIDALKKVDEEHTAAIAAANKAIADAVTKFEASLSALETAHDADIATLNAKIAEEAAKATEAINAAVARITKNEEAVAALKEKDAELAKSINDALAAIQANASKITENAGKIAENATKIAENATAIAGNKAAIAENAAAIDELEADLLDMADQFTAYKAEMAAAIASLEERLATAEAAVETLETNVEELYVLHDNQAALIGDLQNQISALDSFVCEQLDILTEADAAINELIANLDTRFTEYQKTVSAEFAKAYGQIAANTDAINALKAQHEEEIKSLQAQDAAILATLDQHVAWMVELEENLAALDQRVGATEGAIGKIQTNIASMQVTIDALAEDLAGLENTLADFQKQVNEQIVRIDAAIVKALEDAKAYADDAANNAVVTAKGYTDAVMAEFEKNIEKALGDLGQQIEQLNAYAVEIEASLEAYKKENAEALEQLRGDLESMIGDIVNRIQSIVYVPEYTDGKITIDYATFGEYIIEGRSTVEYQVYPAEGAYAIEQAFKNAETYPDFNIWFDIQGLKTRANAPELTVVDAKSNANGRLELTVLARNFSDAFYKGLSTPAEDAAETYNYAVSLAVDLGTNPETGSANLSTCYTQITPGKGNAIKMRIIYNEEDVTNNESVYTEELTYTNIDNNPDFVAIPGYYLVFDFMGKTYLKSELHELGYMVQPVYQGSGIYLPTVATYQILNEETGYTENVLDITKVDANLIGKTYNLVVNWHYGDKKAEKVSAGASLLITKEQAYVDVVPAFTATWNYLKDAEVDAAKLLIAEADQFDPMAVANYAREFGFVLADAVVDNLPADTQLVDILNMEPSEINVNGEPNEKYGIELSAEGANGTIEFTGFEWDATYEIEVVYSLSNVDVNLTFAIETFDRSRKPILVDLGNYTTTYATNLVFDNVEDTMELYLAQTIDAYPANFAGITAADYLLDVFVTKAYHECADDVTANTVNGVEAENTKLVIGEDGQNIFTTYNYADEVASKDGVIVDALAYSKKVTLWYGQEVEFVKSVNFTTPSVWFQRVDQYVYATASGYATDVQPEYAPDSRPETALASFDVNKVDLNAAFDLKDADGLITVPVKDEGDQLRGIAVAKNGNVYRPDFRLTDVKDAYNATTRKGILEYNNYISYYGKDRFVNVDADLYLQNDNGAEMKIATNFDATIEGTEDYTNYVVNVYDPIDLPNGTAYVESVIEYGDYTIDLTNVFSMKDVRGREMINKNRAFGSEYLVYGDDNNGFYNGYYAGDVYGYWTRNEQGVVEAQDEFVPVEVRFDWVLPDDAQQLINKGLLDFQKRTGKIVFKYTSQNDLKRDIVIKVSMTAVTAWGEHTANTEVTFRKGSYTQE